MPPLQQLLQLGDADGHLCSGFGADTHRYRNWSRHRPREGGTGVTITGTSFAAGATVTFGGNAATNVIVLNTRVISATTPAAVAGAVTVTVTNSGGKSGALANGYTYTSTGNPDLGLRLGPGASDSVTVAAGQAASFTLSIGGPGSLGPLL